MRNALGPMGSSLLWFALLVGCSSDAKLNVNNAIPAAVILSHAFGDGVREGEVLTLVGSVTDANHAAEDLTATWSTDGVTACEGAAPSDDGTTTCEIAVPAGDELAVQLEVRDPKGASGSASVNLVITETEAPFVDLLAPEDGSVFFLGEAIAFEATVTDGEDEPGDLTVWFESSVDGRIEIDSSITSAGELAGALDLSLGSHDLALWAEDTDGKTNRDRVSITVQDTPPTAEILTPEEGSDAVYYTGELIALSGLAGDAEDAPADLLAEWSSSLDGTLDVDASVDSSGTIASYATLTEGDHVLSLTVTDSAGQTATDTVVIAVGAENQQPACAITAPADGSVSTFGETLDFAANATDPDVPSDWLTASLSSDKDGDLATITPTTGGLVSFSTDALTADTHTITLTVQDELGLSCTDAINVAVSTPPTIAVSAPVAGATFNEGEPVTFEASVADAEDVAAALSVNWTSSLDGLLLEAAPDSAGTSTFISSDLSQGTHTLTVTVTDGDGLFASVVQSLVVNGGPTAPVVSITPETPQTGDGLAATMVTPSTDPEGDALTYTYAWARDGVDMGEPSSTVDAAATAKGESWTVTVAASDGGLTGPAGIASVEILNTVPTVESATLSPAVPSTHDTLVCTAGATADADGDDVDLSYAWTVNDTVTAETSSSYTATLNVGDTITCTVTPSDDEADGTPVESASVEVTNTAPSIATVNISPDPAYTGNILTCSYTGFEDVDGDADVSTIAWSIDGAPSGTGTTLAGGFTRGNEVICTVTPADGITTGDSLSASITVANSTPSIASVTISPDPAVVTDTLTCSYTGFIDADGDPDASTTSWTIGGSPVGTGTTLAGGFVGGDDVVCTVTPDDGTATGTPISTALTIGNSDPSIESVSISPAEAYAGDTLTCLYTGFFDPDGDPDRSTLEWTLNGVMVSTSSTFAFDVVAGDEVVCTVTPSDDTTTGDPVSAGIIILNTPPTAPSVSISPAEPSAGVDDIICSIASGSSDADGDGVSYTITWTVDGVSYTDAITTTRAGDTIPADETNGDEEWTCTATPNDGDDDGPAGTASVTVQDCFEGWAGTTNDLSAADYSFVGEEAGDFAAFSVSSAGDVDGDGLDDLLVGAFFADDGGSTYLIMGASLGSSSSIDLSVADYIFVGEYGGDYAGESVSSAGDVDGDGLADLLVGARLNDDGGTSAGKAYLILGASLGSSGTIDLSAADYSFVGENADDYAGLSVSSAGDVDGDGLGDILVGALHNDDGGTSAGKTYLILAASLGISSTIDLSAADYSFVGENAGDWAGISVSSAGDVDGDGRDDLLVGAQGNDDGGGSAGKAYLILATSLGSDSTIDLSAADYSFVGENASDYAGGSVSSAGDVDGDGLDDLIVGAYWNGDGGTEAGKAYLIFGGSLGSSSTINLSDANYSFVGENVFDFAGFSVSSVGDVDGDGLDDLLVGAYGNDDGGSNAGKSYLVLAGSLGSTTTIDLSAADYNFVGENVGDRAGLSVSSAGDVNGDGLADIVVGAYGYDDGGAYTGKAYLLLAPTTCNTGPRGTEISISPTTPIEGEDDLVCIIDTEAYDAEADTISYTFEWTVDGIPFTDTATTTEAGDTIPAASTSADEEWTCTVTPNDGESDGASVDAAVTVASEATMDLSLADYIFVGENEGDRAGYSVSSAGDVDGDGLDDLLVGARYNDDGGGDAGKAYLILGASLGSSSTIDLSAADYSFVGENAGDQAGNSVSSAGDVDGDGLDDLLVGARYNDDGGGDAGKAYLILGASLGSSSIDLSAADYSFVGENAFDHAGFSVSSAGDVDGDGLDDLLVGALYNNDGGGNAGKAYLILGASLGSTSPIELSAADYSFVGEDANDYAGKSVSSAGDVDGDGLDDLLVGAYGNGDDAVGKVYLILAASLGSSSTIDLSAADYSFVGENDPDQAGWSVSSAGDVDGDELADLLVGAPFNNDGGFSAGKAYLILGASLGSSSSSSIDLSAADYSFVGENADDGAGQSVSSAGDVDGDGLADLLVGAPFNTDGGYREGKAYLILGASLGSTSTIDLSAVDYSFVGDAYDFAGSSISSAGDVDGDGLADLLVGAPYNDDAGTNAGKAYLILSGG